jgi:hypothetical protein
MTKTQQSSIDLALSLDAQPNVAAILAEQVVLRAELASAQAALTEAETAKKVTFQRLADAYGYPDDQSEALELREADHAITASWRTLKDVQSRLADCDYRLSIERSRTREAMATAMVQTFAPTLEAFATLLEQVDVRWQALSQALGLAAQKFPVGQGPLNPELLRGSNGQVAKKIRRALAQS